MVFGRRHVIVSPAVEKYTFRAPRPFRVTRIKVRCFGQLVSNSDHRAPCSTGAWRFLVGDERTQDIQFDSGYSEDGGARGPRLPAEEGLVPNRVFLDPMGPSKEASKEEHQEGCRL